MPKKQESQESRENRGYVRYIGHSGTRQITRDDFATVGIEHDTVTWNRENQYTVPRADISDEAYFRGIQHDREFVLVSPPAEQTDKE